jgi:hypothetical protein
MGRLIERGSRPRNVSTVDAASTSRLMRGLLDPVGVDTQTRATATLAADIVKHANVHLKSEDVVSRAHAAAEAWADLKERVAGGESVTVEEVQEVAGAFLEILEELAAVAEAARS